MAAAAHHATGRQRRESSRPSGKSSRRNVRRNEDPGRSRKDPRTGPPSCPAAPARPWRRPSSRRTSPPRAATPAETPDPRKSQPIALPGWRDAIRATDRPRTRATMAQRKRSRPMLRIPPSPVRGQRKRLGDAEHDQHGGRRQTTSQAPARAGDSSSRLRPPAATATRASAGASRGRPREAPSRVSRGRPGRAGAREAPRPCAGRRTCAGRSGDRRPAWMRARAGRNRAATASVEAATARPESPVAPPSTTCRKRTLAR